MEESFATKALVLSRRPYREADSHVTVYTIDHGKMDLIARGSQKLGSKLAAHVEPLNLIDLMVISGRQRYYAGSAISRDCFADIKGDLKKVMLAGQALSLLNRLVKEAETDQGLFDLLLGFLQVFRGLEESLEFFQSAFALKLLAELGYAPELYNCGYCQAPITPQKNYFSLIKGGVICGNCWPSLDLNDKDHTLTVSNECVKVMRFVLGNDFGEISHLRLVDPIEQEYRKLTELLMKFNN